jgi:O-succinylbenzoic acid--CoA ligase
VSDERDERGERRGTTDAWRFVDWVARRGRRSPETTAVVDARSGERLTYGALDRAVERTAGRLAALGVTEGDHLGAVVGTRLAAARVVHAAARLGATLVPVDPRGGAAAVRERLDRADATAVVCERPTESVAVDAVGDGRPPLVSVDETGGSVRALSGVEPAPVTPATWGLDDRLLVLYTSGTTGDPKPVTLTAGNVLASATGSALRLGVVPGDRWLCELPAYHTGGIAPFYRTAIYGTTAVVVERERATAPAEEPTGRAGFGAERTLRAAHEHGATGVSLVPTQLRRLLDAADGDDGPDALPESLRFVLLGGGPVPDALVERCGRRDLPVCPTYGLTETASPATTARPDEATAHVGTVGRPLAVTDVLVAREVEAGDEPAGEGPPGYRPCEPGAEGEILVRGPTVTPGYYGDAERTAAAFAGEWLRTGDRGRLVDGRLYVAGRRGDRIVTGGENVDPETVADAVRAVDGARSVAVVGVPDEEWGERVAALVVRDDDATTHEDVLAACRARLPGHAVPRTVRFVDGLPRTTSGTVDREAARALLAGDADDAAAERPDG